MKFDRMVYRDVPREPAVLLRDTAEDRERLYMTLLELSAHGGPGETQKAAHRDADAIMKALRG